MQSKKQSILLVGAGYLGAHLGNILSPSFEVSYTSKTKKENSISLDILNKETYKNIGQNFYDCIIILASTLQGLGTTELKEDYINLDTLGLSGFLQFVTDNKLTAKLVYISSMTVYGIENDVPVKENSILKPLSTYGLSKLLAENIFSFYCRSHQGSGVILRIPGIYGGDRTSGFVYNTAVKCTKQQAIEINTSSLGYWETINIEDLSSWIKKFIENYNWDKDIDVFNISYGVQTDIIECAHLIKKILHSKSDIIIKNKTGYKNFYLDNTKIQQYVKIKDVYHQSLEGYIKNISL